jgi:hypothetical protein
LAKRIEYLNENRILPTEIYYLVDQVRKMGNTAVHNITSSRNDSHTLIYYCYQIGVWFYRKYSKDSSEAVPNFYLELPYQEELNNIGGVIRDFASIEETKKAGIALYKVGSVPKDSKYGFIDPHGEVCIEPKFDNLHSAEFLWNPKGKIFYEGLTAVEIGRKWGFINKSGEFVIKPEFNFAYNYNEGVALVRTNEGERFIDKKGNFIGEETFRGASSFSEGLAAVHFWKDYLEYAWGYINKKGELVIDPIYKDVSDFMNGVAIVNNNIALDKNGNHLFNVDEVTGSFYDYFVERLLDFSEGFAVVELYDYANNSKGYNFIDLDERKLLQKPIQDARYFSKGIAPVKVSGKWGLINYSGDFVIEPIFDDIRRQFERKLVERPIGISNAYAIVEIGNMQGIIDEKGNFIIKPLFNYIKEFSDETAAASWSGKSGYIDAKGNHIIPNKFDWTRSFNKGIAPVLIEKDWKSKWFFINKHGDKVSELKFHVDNLWAFE